MLLYVAKETQREGYRECKRENVHSQAQVAVDVGGKSDVMYILLYLLLGEVSGEERGGH